LSPWLLRPWPTPVCRPSCCVHGLPLSAGHQSLTPCLHASKFAPRPPRAHPTTASTRNVTTEVVKAPWDDPQGKITWGVSVTRNEVAPTTVVTGTISVTVPGPGVLNVTLKGTGGNCSAPVCPGGVVGPGTFICNVTCTPGTTSVTPTVVIDDLPPKTGSQSTVTYVTVKGPSSCIKVDNPFLALYGPSSGARGAWIQKNL
jgi:hypothetical protein